MSRDSRDEKARNAYKRFWRNKRNYDRHIDDTVDARFRAMRSYDLMLKAEAEMQRT